MEQDAELRLLCTASNQMEAQMRAELLRNGGIPSIQKAAKGVFGAARLYTGGWASPCDIYVNAEHYDQALEMLAACFGNDALNQGPESIENE